MSRGAGGIKSWTQSTNRAPYYSDALTPGDAGLLGAAASKTIIPTYTPGGPAIGIALTMTVKNDSGQDASLALTVARSDDASETDTSTVIVPAGDTLGPTMTRVMKIVETNAGAAIQTGRGVRYYFEMEPTR